MKRVMSTYVLTETGFPSMPWHIIGLTGKDSRLFEEIACKIHKNKQSKKFKIHENKHK